MTLHREPAGVRARPGRRSLPRRSPKPGRGRRTEFAPRGPCVARALLASDRIGVTPLPPAKASSGAEFGLSTKVPAARVMVNSSPSTTLSTIQFDTLPPTTRLTVVISFGVGLRCARHRVRAIQLLAVDAHPEGAELPGAVGKRLLFRGEHVGAAVGGLLDDPGHRGPMEHVAFRHPYTFHTLRSSTERILFSQNDRMFSMSRDVPDRAGVRGAAATRCRSSTRWRTGWRQVWLQRGCDGRQAGRVDGIQPAGVRRRAARYLAAGRRRGVDQPGVEAPRGRARAGVDESVACRSATTTCCRT